MFQICNGVHMNLHFFLGVLVNLTCISYHLDYTVQEELISIQGIEDVLAYEQKAKVAKTRRRLIDLLIGDAFLL